MQGLYLGPTVMMTLGAFQFSIATAAYQELTRTTEYRWPSQDRFGQRPVSQFAGMGPETITLPGVIYPEYRGGLGQLDAMRDLAGRGQPQTLIDGRGFVLGQWAIERVEEKQALFAESGIPRKQEFTLQLKRLDDDNVTGNMLAATSAASNLVAAVTANQTPTVVTAAQSLDSIADTAVNSSATLGGKLAASYATCAALAGQIGAQAPAVLSSITRTIDTANGIKVAGTSTVNALQGVRTMGQVSSATSTLIFDMNRLSRMAAGQSSVMGQIFKSMSVASNGQAAYDAVKSALAHTNNVTTLATRAVNGASDLARKIQ